MMMIDSFTHANNVETFPKLWIWISLWKTVACLGSLWHVCVYVCVQGHILIFAGRASESRPQLTES